MIKPLTSLRFFFAIMIFAFHLDIIIHESNSDILKWLHVSIFKEGFIGVSFFFLLSGFILAYNYKESLLTKTQSRHSFFVARFARIYPLHILCFLFALPFGIDSISNTGDLIKNIILNITLTQSFSFNPETIFSFNSPSWSISNEMFFYILFPFLLYPITYLTKHRFRYISLLIFISIIPLLIFYISKSECDFFDQLFYINPFMRIFDFILGILVFNLYENIKNKRYISSVNFTYLEIFSLAILLLFLLFSPHIPQGYRFSCYYWLPISLLILTFSFQKGVISSLLSHKKLIFLGEISFGFYMIHLLVIRYLYLIFDPYLKNNYIAGIMIIIALSLTLLFSVLSFKFYETPANKYLKKSLNK